MDRSTRESYIENEEVFKLRVMYFISVFNTVFYYFVWIG